MLILLLFNLIRPPLLPITEVDLVRVESLTTINQKEVALGLVLQRATRSVCPLLADKASTECNEANKNFFAEEKMRGYYSDGRYIVFGYKSNSLAETESFIQQHQGKIIKRSATNGNYLLAYFPDLAIEDNYQILTEAQKLSFIRYAEPARKMQICLIPNDTFFLSSQWDKWIMYSDLIWDLTLGSSAITVAICDQGTDYRHPDLSANFNPYFLGYDFVDLDPDPYPDSTSEMHGTHVAGIIGAMIDNRIGIAGWAQVQLLSVRVLDEKGVGSDYDVAEGIRWSTDQGARIINLSLGGYEYSSVLAEAVEYAWDNGVLLLAATGNDGISEIYYPAKFSQCVAVGALDQDNHIANFSNYGYEQELVCPGVYILSTINNNQYAFASGTSMACPQASGVAALILSVFPNLSNQKLRAILDVATIDLGSSGKDSRYGYGLLNAYRAYTLAQILTTQDKISKTVGFSLAKRKSDASRFELSNLLIYDAIGRKTDKINTRGVYFIKDLKTNTRIKKIIIR